MGLFVIVVIVAIIGYALTSPKSQRPSLKEHGHSCGFVVVVCVLALVVFLVAMASVHVPGQ